MTRLTVLIVTVMATLVLTTGTSGAEQAAPSLANPSYLVDGVAHPSGDGAEEPEGDEDDGPIDCSIPDNQDDSGCDTGDVNDSEGAVGDTGDLEASSGGADNVVPRGGVETGAGGTAAPAVP